MTLSAQSRRVWTQEQVDHGVTRPATTLTHPLPSAVLPSRRPTHPGHTKQGASQRRAPKTTQLWWEACSPSAIHQMASLIDPSAYGL